MGKRDLPADTLAFRRTFAGGVAGFCVGFGLAAGLFVFILTGLGTSVGWWAVATGVIHAVPVSFLAGAAGAAAVVKSLEWWHYRRGVYKCVYCARPLRRGVTGCVCWAEPSHPLADLYAKMRRQHHPPPLRHYRQRLAAVLAAYALLIPVAVLFTITAPRPRPRPMPADVLMAHVVLSGLLAVSAGVATSTLGVLKRGRRFRLRAEAFLRVFALWPVLAGIVIAGLALLGG